MKIPVLITAMLCLSACGGGGGSSSSSSSSISSTPSAQSSSQASSIAAYNPEDNHWQLVFDDEFDGEALDQSKWSYEYNCKGNGDELQCYTENKENLYLSDGKLHIVARKENYSGPAYWNDEPEYDRNDTSKTLPYTSARIRTLKKADWRYGRIEVKAKMPQGYGTWPAIWMMPSDNTYGAWPASGEIDIFEAFGSNTPNWGNKIAGTLHYGQACCENFVRAMTGADTVPPGNKIWNDYHIYAFEWEADEMRWYVDNQLFEVQRSDGWFNVYGEEGEKIITNGRQPFEQAFHLILNLAIDGMAGSSLQQTSFPQEMTVDYMRVYQCALDTETGKGCASFADKAPAPITTTPLLKNAYFSDELNPQHFSYQGQNYDAQLQLQATSEQDKPMEPVVVEQQEDHKLWSLEFGSGGGSGAIQWLAPQGSSFENAFDMSGNTRFAQLRFDLLVESLDANSEISVGMQSLNGGQSFYTLKNIQVGQWQSVAIPYINLVAETGAGVNSGLVTHPFVITASGAANLQLNNIQFECRAQSCGIKPLVKGRDLYTDFTIFGDAIDPLWVNTIQTYDSEADKAKIAVSQKAVEGRGKVIDAQWPDVDGQTSLFYFTSTVARNAGAFAYQGQLSFDVKVLSYGNNTQGLDAGIWCGWPCGSANIPVPQVPADGNWHTVKMPIKDFVSFGSLDLTQVMEAFVLFPALGDQRGVHLQVDNIRWEIN